MYLLVFGIVLLTIPLTMMMAITVMLKGTKGKGFGDFNSAQGLIFLLLVIIAATRGWLQLVPWMTGLFLMASGVALVAHFSLPFTLLCESVALLVSLLTLVLYNRYGPGRR